MGSLWNKKVGLNDLEDLLACIEQSQPQEIPFFSEFLWFWASEYLVSQRLWLPRTLHKLRAAQSKVTERGLHFPACLGTWGLCRPWEAPALRASWGGSQGGEATDAEGAVGRRPGLHGRSRCSIWGRKGSETIYSSVRGGHSREVGADPEPRDADPIRQQMRFRGAMVSFSL